MKLTGTDNKSFELWVIGYQFPGIHHDMYDSNWLRIGIKVGGLKKPWITSDSSLLTWELDALRGWFQSLGTPNQCEEITFIEPNLGFKLVEIDGETFIRIVLELESKPDWFNAEEEFLMDILSEPGQINESISRLSLDLMRFPPRAGVRL